MKGSQSKRIAGERQGEYNITEEGKHFLGTITSKFADGDDPMLVLFWDYEVLDALVVDLQNQNLASLPPCPEYINISTTE